MSIEVKEEQESAVSIKYRWRDKCILIVEDVKTNHMLIDRILRWTHARLLWAMDGEQAIQLCHENSNIDLILMDIRLPKINGYDATREIRKFMKDVPIIAQTAYVMPEESGKVLEAGCNDLITKPIVKDVLLETVARYINK